MFGLTTKLFALCIQATTYGSFADNPFEDSSFQRGMNVYLEERDAQATDDFHWTTQLLLDRLDEVGVNSVSVTWPIFTDGRRSSRIYAGEGSLSLDSLRRVVAISKARGFGVTLHPILDERSIQLSGSRHWRGTIDPWEVDQWFSDYKQLLVNYAKVAEEFGVDAVVIAAELNSMEGYYEHWRELIAAVREVYRGQVGYASNRGVSDSFPWELVDFIGVDAFFSLPLPNNASVAEMVVALREQWADIADQARAVGLPLVFTEVGTGAQVGSFQRSWMWNHRTAPDPEAQARYYEAVCTVWKSELRGMYWWKATLYPPRAEDAWTSASFDPFGKSAEAKMRDCFSD